MGAPPEMVDTMATAAQDGFDTAIGCWYGSDGSI